MNAGSIEDAGAGASQSDCPRAGVCVDLRPTQSPDFNAAKALSTVLFPVSGMAGASPRSCLVQRSVRKSVASVAVDSATHVPLLSWFTSTTPKAFASLAFHDRRAE